jgi:hypothetical protein
VTVQLWDISHGQHLTAIRPTADGWRDSIIDLAWNATAMQWEHLQHVCADLRDIDDIATDDEVGELIRRVDEALRDIYPREQDLPIPAVYVQRGERAQFLAAIEGRQ